MVTKVTVNDVGPRDGLQNQAKHLSVEGRVQLIASLLEAGVNNIEMGSFVSPRAVPAMANTDQVFAQLNPSAANFSALIPNLRGYELAREAGLANVVMVVYASDAMAQENVKMTKALAEQATTKILNLAAADGVAVLVTIAVAFACPFAGASDAQEVRRLAQRMLQAGASRVVIADTIGAANPEQVHDLMGHLVADCGTDQVAVHLHDTRALGMANLYAALDAGVRHFDASIARMGGCPFAPGASGNIATEDAVMMLHSMGYETGIDLPKLLETSDLATQLADSAPGGRSKTWLGPWLERGHTF